MPPKPWRDGPRPKTKTVPAKRGAPMSSGVSLVPPQSASFPTQRFFAIALFFLLQGVKLGAVKSYFNFGVFSMLDIAFTYLLPEFAIPRLSFKRRVVLFQIAALMVVNYSLFISAGWLLPLFSVFFKYILSWLGVRLPIYGALDTDLITGKYIVDVLPEATAKLDLISPLCLSENPDKPVYMRLTLDGTWPSAVQLSQAPLGNTEDFKRIEYTRRDLAKFPYDYQAKEMYLPASEPGAYYLDGITDMETGLRVRIQRERIVIPPCPRVEVVSLSESNICQNQQFTAEVKARGVAPLTVNIDGKWYTLGEALPDDGVTTVAYSVEKRAPNHQGSVEVLAYNVTDKLGCSPRANSNQGVLSSASAHVLEQTIAELKYQRLANVDGSVVAEVNVNGEDSPFELEFIGPDQPFTLELYHAGRQYLKLTEIGEYKLVGVKGAKCPGYASGSLEVFSPPPVSLSVQFKVIEEKCAGLSGVDAIIDLGGMGPWKVGYRTLKGSRVLSQHTVELNGDRNNVVQFRPRNIGEFTYEISFVEDRYHKLALSGAKFSTSQLITELPGAQFAPVKVTKLCGSSSTELEIQVRGKGPFIIKYSVDDKQEYEVRTEGEKDSDAVKIALDGLVSGNHFVRLKSLTDRNNCVIDLDGIRSPNILAMPELAQIGFAHPGAYKSADPVDMPLHLTASNLKYPATLEYEHEFEGAKSKYSVTLHRFEDAIPATKPGSYKLLSLNDNICGGTVVGDQSISISLYNRPTIKLASTELLGMCQKSPKPLPALIVLEGEAPFVVAHEVVDPQGNSQTATLKIHRNELSLDLASQLIGEYTHYLWVADDRYPEIRKQQYMTFRHEVYAPAEAVFQTRQHIKTCENSPLTDPIPVALKGKAPFLLTLQIGREIKVIMVESARKLDLRKEIRPITETGKLKMRILDVADANGCKTVPIHPSNEIDIEVMAQPKVPALAKKDYCVGDRVVFPLKGHGPHFNVEYSYNGKKRHAKAAGLHKRFEVLAKKPGNITLTSVSDDSGCKRDTAVVAEVHDLPGSTITESPHWSIYQGDQISLGFAFEGTAPFSFVYTHIVDGVVKERKEIRNIMEPTYSMIVEEGGEYEIVELQDKYCRTVRTHL